MLKAVLDTQVILRGATARTATITGQIYAAGALLELLRRRGTAVTPTIAIRQSRDPDDDKFLECAVTGGATYIVSADDDLLALHEVQGILIINAPVFWQALR